MTTHSSSSHLIMVDQRIMLIITHFEEQKVCVCEWCSFPKFLTLHGLHSPSKLDSASLFEGGVRVVAFISGGYLPSAMAGRVIVGRMHIADWYATLAHVVGEDPTDHKAEAANLPPIDSINMWPMLMGENSTSPRDTIILATPNINDNTTGIISGPFKFLRGIQDLSFVPGIHMPNSSDTWMNQSISCFPGCLFNLEMDPYELHDVASEYPLVIDSLYALANEAIADSYQTPGSMLEDPAASATAENDYHGFWGPWLPDNPPSPPQPPSPPPSFGFYIRYKGDPSLCVTVNKGVDYEKPGSSWDVSGEVQLGSCDAYSKWALDLEQDTLYNVGIAETDWERAYLRQNVDCTIQTRMVTMKNYNGKGASFQPSNGTLAVSQCGGMCAIPSTKWGNLFNVTLVLNSCDASSANQFYLDNP
eukprot:m.174809 g.174809  ORF g.174809 m.174809 type:complete len:418 (-) comp13510_c0_seq9:1203-2456(-)